MKSQRRSLPVDDLVEAERFYGEVLTEVFGGYLANRYVLTTDELIQARKAAALAERQGEEAAWMALPSSRVILGDTHVYLCLAERHMPQPPPEHLRGTPRLAITATADQVEQACAVFRREEVAFLGPERYDAPCPVERALYFRDPAGNFLEICCPRAGEGG